MSICSDQTVWTAIAAIGSIAVTIVALMPILKDRHNLKLHIRCLDEVSSTGRYMVEISVTNIGRRKAFLDNLIIEYVDFQPNIDNINPNQAELEEGRHTIIKSDSWQLTAISKPKDIYVVDSLGKKWRIRKDEFKKFIRDIEKLNHEKAPTIREEEKRREQLRKEYEKGQRKRKESTEQHE